MVNTTCAVRECLSSSRTNKDIRFHQFPQTAERIKQWLEACGRADLYKKSHESLKYVYVCGLHFEPRLYGKRSLKKHAKPTLHLPGKEVTSVPTQTETLFLLKCNPPLPTTFTTDIDGRAIISRVYHYLDRQYEQLKTLTDNQAALTPFSDILKSTSNATGIHETLVKHIMEQELLLGSVTHARVKMPQSHCVRDRPQIQYHVHITKVSSSMVHAAADTQNNQNKEQEQSVSQEKSDASDPIKCEPTEPKESSVSDVQDTATPDTSDVAVKMEIENPDEEYGLVTDADPLESESSTDYLSSSMTAHTAIDIAPTVVLNTLSNSSGQHHSPDTPVTVKTEPADGDESPSTTDHASPSLTALTEMETEPTADECCTSVYLVASDKPQAKPKTKRPKQSEIIHITTAMKSQIIALHKQKIAISEISRRLKLSRKTVRLWIHRHENTGQLVRLRPGPQPTGYTDASPRHRDIVAAHIADNNASTRSTASAHGVSSQTVRNHLRVAGLMGAKTKKRRVHSGIEINK